MERTDRTAQGAADWHSSQRGLMMDPYGHPVLQNLKVFAISYPIAILATGTALIATDRAYFLLVAGDEAGSFLKHETFFSSILLMPFVFLGLFFVLLLPCVMAFGILKLLKRREFIAYLTASILVTIILTLLLMNFDNYPSPYDKPRQVKETLGAIVAFLPSMVAGSFVFQKIEEKFAGQRK